MKQPTGKPTPLQRALVHAAMYANLQTADIVTKEEVRLVLDELERLRSESKSNSEPRLCDFDKGPWVAAQSGAFVDSDDFEHDARLNISGDFENADARYAYACALAATLNGANPLHKPNSI